MSVKKLLKLIKQATCHRCRKQFHLGGLNIIYTAIAVICAACMNIISLEGKILEGPWRETQNLQLTWANEIQLNRVRKTGVVPDFIV